MWHGGDGSALRLNRALRVVIGGGGIQPARCQRAGDGTAATPLVVGVGGGGEGQNRQAPYKRQDERVPVEPYAISLENESKWPKIVSQASRAGHLPSPTCPPRARWSPRDVAEGQRIGPLEFVLRSTLRGVSPWWRWVGGASSLGTSNRNPPVEALVPVGWNNQVCP